MKQEPMKYEKGTHEIWNRTPWHMKKEAMKYETGTHEIWKRNPWNMKPEPMAYTIHIADFLGKHRNIGTYLARYQISSIFIHFK